MLVVRVCPSGQVVAGSKLTMSGQEVVVAREVEKADRVLTLRDAKGFPMWSGRLRGKVQR
jgi:hypothetical protein